MIRKIFLLLSFLFFLTLSPANAAFSDVPNDHIYKDAINYIQEQGIVNGYSDGTYRPDDPITRGEFTKIITGVVYGLDQQSGQLELMYCLANNYKSVTGKTYYEYNDLFSDVRGGRDDFYNFADGVCLSDLFDCASGNRTRTGNHPFVDYICLAKKNNLISGYSDGSYKPDAYITVGEASKILANSFDIYDTDFGIPTEGNWFSPYLKSLNAAIAFPYTLKDIEQKLTRGEMADLVAKLKYNKEGKNFVEDTVNSNLRKVKVYFHDSEIDPQVTDCAANNYYLAFVPFDNTPVRRTVEYVLNTYNVIGQHGYIIDSINLVEGQAEIRIGRTGYGFGTCGGATVSTSVEKSVEALEGVENATIIGGEGTFI